MFLPCASTGVYVCFCPRGQPQLVDIVWPGQTAIDPASGFSLVKDEEGTVNLPACERKLEGRGQQGFEGAEKTLEIEFDPDIGHEDGLRAIRREQWDAILQQVRYESGACLHAGSFFRFAWAGMNAGLRPSVSFVDKSSFLRDTGQYLRLHGARLAHPDPTRT